jgi:hypothetical protein
MTEQRRVPLLKKYDLDDICRRCYFRDQCDGYYTDKRPTPCYAAHRLELDANEFARRVHRLPDDEATWLDYQDEMSEAFAASRGVL